MAKRVQRSRRWSRPEALAWIVTLSLDEVEEIRHFIRSATPVGDKEGVQLLRMRLAFRGLYAKGGVPTAEVGVRIAAAEDNLDLAVLGNRVHVNSDGSYRSKDVRQLFAKPQEQRPGRSQGQGRGRNVDAYYDEEFINRLARYLISKPRHLNRDDLRVHIFGSDIHRNGFPAMIRLAAVRAESWISADEQSYGYIQEYGNPFPGKLRGLSPAEAVEKRANLATWMTGGARRMPNAEPA